MKRVILLIYPLLLLFFIVFANLLFTRGIKKGDKVAILMMNCLEWLPIYFGILKTGALVVPMN